MDAGNALGLQGESKAALVELSTAVQVGERLVAEHPEKPRWRHDLALAQQSEATMMADAGDCGRAHDLPDGPRHAGTAGEPGAPGRRRAARGDRHVRADRPRPDGPGRHRRRRGAVSGLARHSPAPRREGWIPAVLAARPGHQFGQRSATSLARRGTPRARSLSIERPWPSTSGYYGHRPQQQRVAARAVQRARGRRRAAEGQWAWTGPSSSIAPPRPSPSATPSGRRTRRTGPVPALLPLVHRRPLAQQARLRRGATEYPGHLLAERLATLDPASGGRQRGVSISHIKMGNALVLLSDLPGALLAYRASLRAILERLVRVDPSNANWLRDLCLVHGKSAACSATAVTAQAPSPRRAPRWSATSVWPTRTRETRSRRASSDVPVASSARCSRPTIRRRRPASSAPR